MLAVINIAHGLLTRRVLADVGALVHEPMPLSRIEHELSIGDPMLVRAAVFELARTGALHAPALRVQPLSLLSVFEPAS